jgi:predicted nucleic acid-binding Zn ribbon protein
MSRDEPRTGDGADAADRPPAADGAPDLGDPEALEPLHAAHDALARARRGARQRGLRPGAPAGAGRRRAVGQPAPSGKDDRDPHLVGTEIERLVAARGWDTDVQVGAVIGRWPAIVGDQVAANVEVVAFEGTVLTVRAVSTAWATQMRLLASTILGRIETEVGVGVVTEIVVRGPGGPSWRKGPLSSGGRGPRDTYG